MRSRGIIGPLVFTALASVATVSAAAATADETAVLGTVQMLLDGWREDDAGKLERALHKDFRKVTLHLQDARWNLAAMDRATLIGLMGRIDRGSWDDCLLKPQVHVEGPIAVAWWPYRFTVRYAEAGERHAADHCGIQRFQLYREAGGWQTVNFADTHSDACPKQSTGRETA